MKADNKATVVVFSRNYITALGAVRCLGSAGYTVDLVASSKEKGAADIAGCSKYIHNYSEVVFRRGGAVENKALYDKLIERANAYEEKPILIPTDDYTTEIMDLGRDLLEPYFVMPSFCGDNNGGLSTFQDVNVQGEMAQKAGFSLPKEWVVTLEGVQGNEEEEPEFVIPEELKYPCVCKPLEGVEGSSVVRKFLTENGLRTYINKMNEKTTCGSILIREKLKVDRVIEVAGVALDQEIIIPAISEKLESARYDDRVTIAEKIVSVDKLGDTFQKLEKLMQQFHYVGLFDLTLHVSGDELYFNKVHFRAGKLNFCYKISGVNMLDLYVKGLLGEEIKPEEKVASQLGKIIVSDNAVWEDFVKGYKGKKNLHDCLEAGRLLVNRSSDPKPGELLRKRSKNLIFRRKIAKKLRPVKRFVRKVIFPILRPIKHTLLGYPQTKKANKRKRYQARVLVVGRNYCSNLCMARAFGTAGHEVEILRIFQRKPRLREIMKMAKPDAYSKYVKAFYVCVVRKSRKSFIQRLVRIANKRQKMLLIPADDFVASIVDEYYQVLSKFYLIPNAGNRAGGINDLMSKAVQKDLALQAGLPVVKSCIVKSENGQFEIPDTVTYPCFIKPNISKNGSKTKMRRCDSYEELHATFTEYAKEKDFDMLVEDFIEIGRECSILGVSTKDGVLSPGFFGAEMGGHGSHRGVALTGRVEDCAPRQQLIDDISRFIETLGYEGLFDVDLIESTDGKLYFVELNLRYGGSGYSIVKSGANLPGMFADYMLLGKPVDMNCKIEEYGKSFISERIAIDEYIEGFMTMKEIDKCMDEADIHFIKDDEDPRPYNHFKKFYIPATVRRKMLMRQNKGQE